jgi:hypothetical protein
MCDSTGEDTMPTRREFFHDVAGAMAGIVFAGCGLVEVAEAQPQSGSAAPAGSGGRPSREDG